MYTYYIQYTTDFHLIAALGAVGDLSAGKIYLIGPRTKVVDRVLGMEGESRVSSDGPQITLYILEEGHQTLEVFSVK